MLLWNFWAKKNVLAILVFFFFFKLYWYNGTELKACCYVTSYEQALPMFCWGGPHCQTKNSPLSSYVSILSNGSPALISHLFFFLNTSLFFTTPFSSCSLHCPNYLIRTDAFSPFFLISEFSLSKAHTFSLEQTDSPLDSEPFLWGLQ